MHILYANVCVYALMRPTAVAILIVMTYHFDFTFLPTTLVVQVKQLVQYVCMTQWRNDGVAAASSDGGPTGGRGPQQFYFILNQRGGALT